jgi:hypothetical protein
MPPESLSKDALLQWLASTRQVYLLDQYQETPILLPRARIFIFLVPEH